MPPQLRDWTKFSDEPRPSEALKSGDLQRALRDFALQQLLELRFPLAMRSDGPGIGFGTALWLLGDREGAGHVWAQVTETVYKGRYTHSSHWTFQGPLLLWFASVRLECQDWHDLADRTLDRLLAKQGLKEARGSELAKFLQRKIDLDDVRSHFSDGKLCERQLQRASFYAGVRALEDGDTGAARRHWNSLDQPTLASVEFEYYLAAHEKALLCQRTEPT